MSSFTETEVKLLVSDLAVVESRLQDVGAQLTVPRVLERNVRFENTEQSLTAHGIVLRLREDNVVRLTYKEPSVGVTDGIITRFEAEVTVSDFATMQLILAKLGYQPAMTYEKYRTTYHLDETEVLLDELPYGNFVEIEGTSATIEATISTLELGDAPRLPASYTRLFENLRAKLSLNFHDLTFANFEDIEIPSDIFIGK